MKHPWILATALLGLTGTLSAANLVDWGHFEQGKDLGAYADDGASTISAKQVEGPAKGQKALRMDASLAKWGGVWANVQGQDLSQAGGLRFKAKAGQPGQLTVSLVDAKKAQVEAVISVKAGDWQGFAIPMSLFHKSAWQAPEAPKDGVFDPAHLSGLNLSPRAPGEHSFSVGPIEIVNGPVEGKTGLMDGSGKDGALMVQDFEDLQAGAFGTFQDDKTGCTIKLQMVDGGRSGKAAQFDDDLKDGGWLGAWMRAGDSWGGQDWSGAKSLHLWVKSSAPTSLELAFNDANQNAYLAPAVQTQGHGWEALVVPFDGFKLNEYYQPAQAKKGAPLDLSHIDSFNIGVKSPGKGSFLVDDVILYKK